MKTKKYICFILSLLLAFPCLCFSSCKSNFGDELSTENTQEEGKNENPNYTAPAKYKELANDDTVYRAGVYTGYSIILRKYMELESGEVTGTNLYEIMLEHPGEADPVHEDPTCSHDSARCPTSSATMPNKVLIVKQESGLPLIFYFAIDFYTYYVEDGTVERTGKLAELRGYDVETGEYTSVAKIQMSTVDNAVLYKGKIYVTGNSGWAFGVIDIVTGSSKIVESEEFYNEYNVLGVLNDRLYYMHVFGEESSETHKTVKNNCVIKSCAPDLGDERIEYDLGDFGSDYPRGANTMYFDSYMDGSVIYFPRNVRCEKDPSEGSADVTPYYVKEDLRVFDLCALDLGDISGGEKLILSGAFKCAVKNGKLYYTLVDYKELGVVSTLSVSSPVSMFASTDGGVLYETDIASGATREVCRDSGYNIREIYEITDDGKMFFYGTSYCDFEPGIDALSMIVLYNMIDTSTGKVTELYSMYKDVSAE